MCRCSVRPMGSAVRTARADESAQRVLTLMLLWRKGVIVFHDTQDKARVALPMVLQATTQSGLGWQECREAFR